tara:strand:+ start:715 stop:1026 length:312 start_codon:yes stop_codon:yes gene_type:complete
VSILKKIYVFTCLILLSGCVSSTAFLGPIFTGAKTGSVYQASISYGGNKFINKAMKIQKNESFKKLLDKDYDKTIEYQEPIILLTYVVDNIEITEVLEPEPLP